MYIFSQIPRWTWWRYPVHVINPLLKFICSSTKHILFFQLVLFYFTATALWTPQHAVVETGSWNCLHMCRANWNPRNNDNFTNLNPCIVSVKWKPELSDIGLSCFLSITLGSSILEVLFELVTETWRNIIRVENWNDSPAKYYLYSTRMVKLTNTYQLTVQVYYVDSARLFSCVAQ